MEDGAALPDFRRINNANLRVIVVFKSFQGAACLQKTQIGSKL